MANNLVEIANIKGPRGFDGQIGPQGSDGIPGVNAVENAAAIAAYFESTGTNAAKTALFNAIPTLAVSSFLPTGYNPGVTDIKAALDAAIAAAPEGSVVQLPRGEAVFLSFCEPITKALTIDLNGCSLIVDPTPGAGVAGKPVFFFTGTLSASSNPFAATAEAATSVTVSVAAAAGYAVGDYILLSDSTIVLPWDSGIPGATPIYPDGYTGREETNIVAAVDGVTGVITLGKPTEWAYTATPIARKITKMLQAPQVINAARIHEIDPGGPQYAHQSGPDCPHLVHFMYAETPQVENIAFDGWNMHAVNFYRCVNPQLSRSTGRNPYRPTIGGHGYLSRFERTLGGSVQDCYSEKVRHHTDYVMAYDATSSGNTAVAPVSAAYTGHGFGSKRIISAHDTVLDGGAAWGWMVGNLAFNADYDFTIISPRYSGTSAGITFHARAQGLKVVAPDIRTSARAIVMTTGAGRLDIDGGQLASVGASVDANTLLVRAKQAASSLYGLAPGSVRVRGTRLGGANPSVSIETAGAVELIDLIADQCDSDAVGFAFNVIDVKAAASLRASGNRFAGKYGRAIIVSGAAPSGEYAVELNDARGFTVTAIALPAAANLRFIGNSAANNAVTAWTITGDLITATAGAAGYGGVILGNIPRTLDEARATNVFVSGPAGTARQVQFSSGDLLRWVVRATSATESGGNAGSDFEILARTDAGGAGPQVMLAKRNGDTTFGASGAKVGFYGGAGVVKPTVSGAKGGNAALTSLIAALVALGLVVDGSS